MKKFFYFAASALMLMACSKTEVLPVNNEVEANDGIKFEVYTQRGLSTRAGTPGDIDNNNIGTIGFGVFAYYTAGEKYDANAKPNFMYNQKVYKESATADVWTYEPVKYWPNEYGDAAKSDDKDYVTFFAYAPWTEFEPTTGEVKGENVDNLKNIISVNKNNGVGDPVIKYVVDTDPATSVDLLWGVAAATAENNYSAIGGNAVTITEGKPFKDLVKPGKPDSDKLSFNLRHSLAKVKFTIDYIADAVTPGASDVVIDSAKTRIYVRSIKIGGWATKGALNLNNAVPNKPLWKDYDGVKDLAFDDVTFFDGRKDGKEGDVNGVQSNELPQGLNPEIVENYADVANNHTANEAPKFTGVNKTTGVTNKPQLLFGGSETADNGGYFYIIPRNENTPVDISIVYDVETIDTALAGLLSDGTTHGLSIENVIYKNAILGQSTDFEPGKQYLIKIHLGMTSVKIEAEVTDWVPTNTQEVDLPDNQDPTIASAIDFVYDGFNYTGEFSIDDEGNIAYNKGTATDEQMMNDFARFLGAIHKVCYVNKITYGDKDYAWDEEAIIAFALGVDGAPLKGSNFIWYKDTFIQNNVPVWRTDPEWNVPVPVKGTDYNTLVSAVVADAATLATSGLELTTDNTKLGTTGMIKFVLAD